MFPPHDDRGLNLVTGVRRTTANILAVCLIRKGEDYQHPDFGMAPLIFEPLSNYAPQYWVHQAEAEIRRWVPGLDKLSVNIVDYEDYKNRLRTEILFTPRQTPDQNILTFGWYAYQGAIWDQDFETFRQDVTLNGQPFGGLG